MQDEEDHLYAIRIHNSSTKIDYDNRKKSHYSFAEEEATSVHAKKTTAHERRKKSQTEYGRISRVRFRTCTKGFSIKQTYASSNFLKFLKKFFCRDRYLFYISFIP